mgnify:CR=1 FL=1
MAGRGRRPTELLWTVIPVMLVLFLAARSWVAVFDLGRPAVASAVITAALVSGNAGGPATLRGDHDQASEVASPPPSCSWA